jgi:hypothetical protein
MMDEKYSIVFIIFSSHVKNVGLFCYKIDIFLKVLKRDKM